MALFTLTDIKIGSRGSVSIGDLRESGSGILPSRYESNTYRYPIDIGDTNKGHYMVIHINQQDKTQFSGTTTDDLPTIFENRNSTGVYPGGVYSTSILAEALLKVADSSAAKSAGSFAQGLLDKLPNVAKTLNIPESSSQTFTDALKKFGSASKETVVSWLKQAESKKFVRTITRTTDTIALYMPDTLQFQHQQLYSEMNLGGGLFAKLGALADAGKSLKDVRDSGSFAQFAGRNLSPFVLNALTNFAGDAGRAVFAGLTGTVVNPQLELLYSSPKFREFRFDFMLYPRSQKEAEEVQNILERLRFHQAPEVLGQGSPGGLGSFFLVPPSEFDIKFYYNGSINPNIPPISTCVLQQIDIDYAPTGFAAYEKPNQLTARLGGTGMPVGIRLGLQFMETEILTKANYRSKKSEPYIGVSFPNTPGVDPNQRF